MVNHLLYCPIQLILPVDWLIHSLVHPIQLVAEAPVCYGVGVEG